MLRLVLLMVEGGEFHEIFVTCPVFLEKNPRITKMESILEQASLQQKIYSSLKLKEKDPGLDRVQELNNRSEQYKEAEGLLAILTTKREEILNLLKDTKANLKAVESLIEIANAEADVPENYTPTQHESCLYVKSKMDLGKNVVVVSVGAKVYLEFTFKEAQDFYSNQLKIGNEQLDIVEKRYNKYARDVGNFLDETLRVKYGIGK